MIAIKGSFALNFKRSRKSRREIVCTLGSKPRRVISPFFLLPSPIPLPLYYYFVPRNPPLPILNIILTSPFPPPPWPNSLSLLSLSIPSPFSILTFSLSFLPFPIFNFHPVSSRSSNHITSFLSPNPSLQIIYWLSRPSSHLFYHPNSSSPYLLSLPLFSSHLPLLLRSPTYHLLSIQFITNFRIMTPPKTLSHSSIPPFSPLFYYFPINSFVYSPDPTPDSINRSTSPHLVSYVIHPIFPISRPFLKTPLLSHYIPATHPTPSPTLLYPSPLHPPLLHSSITLPLTPLFIHLTLLPTQLVVLPLLI